MGLFYFFTGIGSFMGSLALCAFKTFIYSSSYADDISCLACHLNYYFYMLAGLQLVGTLLFTAVDCKYAIVNNTSLRHLILCAMWIFLFSRRSTSACRWWVRGVCRPRRRKQPVTRSSLTHFDIRLRIVSESLSSAWSIPIIGDSPRKLHEAHNANATHVRTHRAQLAVVERQNLNYKAKLQQLLGAVSNNNESWTVP